MSLRQKLLFGILAIYSVTLGVLAVLLSLDRSARQAVESERREAENRYTNRLFANMFQGRASGELQQLDSDDVVPALLQWDLWDDVEDPVLLSLDQDEDIFINPAGAPASGRPFDSDRLRRLIQTAIDTEDLVEDGDYLAYYLVADAGRRWGVGFKRPVAVADDYRPLVDARMVFILMAVGIPLITLVSYTLLTRVVIRPIDHLQEASHRVARGDYSAVIPPRAEGAGDEIDQLVDAFNTMLGEVRDYRENLEQRVREATEKIRQTERRLVTAQRLAATGKLAAGIGHEINNPLGGMINIARRLTNQDFTDDKRREYLELVLDGLLRIEATVQKMVPLSIREVKPQVVELGKVLRQARELVRYRTDQEDVDVSMQVQGAELSVFGDPNELHQVYLNLLINALDAMKRQDGPGKIVVRARRVGDWIETSVEDSGHGMTEDQIQQAFDLFYTTKDAGEGSGLGLSIVHNVVDNHGGTVSIRSRVGKGTSVDIRLPVAERGGGAELT